MLPSTVGDSTHIQEFGIQSWPSWSHQGHRCLGSQVFSELQRNWQEYSPAEPAVKFIQTRTDVLLASLGRMVDVVVKCLFVLVLSALLGRLHTRVRVKYGRDEMLESLLETDQSRIRRYTVCMQLAWTNPNILEISYNRAAVFIHIVASSMELDEFVTNDKFM